MVERSDTTGEFGIGDPHPGGMPAFAEDAGIPPGCKAAFDSRTGGVASLNHRLMAEIPSGSKKLHTTSFANASGLRPTMTHSPNFRDEPKLRVVTQLWDDIASSNRPIVVPPDVLSESTPGRMN